MTLDDGGAPVRREDFWLGERVRLRGVEPEDWEVFRSFDHHADTQRNAYQLFPPRSAEGSRAWAKSASLEGPDGDRYRFAVEALDTGRLVGTINTTDTDPVSGRFSYGLGIGPEFRRRGYAADSIRLVLSFMFGERRYVRCATQVYGFNTASLALHRRLGFTEEGRLRRHLFMGGRHHDEVLFGMLAEEFAELEAKAGRAPYLEARG